MSGYTVFVLAFALGLALSMSPAASPPVESTSEAGDENAARKNNISFKGAYALHLLQARDSQHPDPTRVAPSLDHLGGLVLAYERTLVAGWLSLELNKPFLFGVGRFDFPIDAGLRLIHRWGRVEPFLGAGVTFNARFFFAQRDEIEGRPFDISFGVATVAGLAIWIAPRWAIELEGGYSWIPVGTVVAHEINGALGPVFAF